MIANIPTIVLAHLQTWATMPIALPDRPIDRPDPPAPWLLVEFPGATSVQDTIGAPGSNRYLGTASVWVHVFVPAGPDSNSWTLACQIADLFRGKILPDTEVRVCDIAISGGENADKGVWWRRTVAIELETDDEG